METTPIPTPPIIRYTTNCVKSVQRAHPKADAEKRIAEITIVNFLYFQTKPLCSTRHGRV